MALIDSPRNKLDVKVFDKHGISATLITESVTYNEYGDKVISSEPSSTITIVPYNYFTGRLNYQGFGTLNEGDVDVIVRYDVDIQTKQQIVFNGIQYEVKIVEDYFAYGDSLAKNVRITKNLA